MILNHIILSKVKPEVSYCAVRCRVWDKLSSPSQNGVWVGAHKDFELTYKSVNFSAYWTRWRHDGGPSLRVHLAPLFNMFLYTSYLPQSFMNLVIVPLVKYKSGDLSDVNNYRAICISTAMSKLLDYAISSVIQTETVYDTYQFGFKPGHSTGLCTNVFKRTVEYFTSRGSHVFTCLLTFKRLSILLTIGGCFKSYYMMVLISLLLDCWHIGIVIKRHVGLSGGKIVCLGVFDLVMALGRVEFCHPFCSQGTLGNCYVSWLKPMLVAILVACM